MTLITVVGGHSWPGFMPSREATEHGQWQPCEGRGGEACRGKSQTTGRATGRWGAVEVCGFGVPLPRSNLLAAQVSKNCCNRTNVGGPGALCKRFLHQGPNDWSRRGWWLLAVGGQRPPCTQARCASARALALGITHGAGDGPPPIGHPISCPGFAAPGVWWCGLSCAGARAESCWA